MPYKDLATRQTAHAKKLARAKDARYRMRHPERARAKVIKWRTEHPEDYHASIIKSREKQRAKRLAQNPEERPPRPERFRERDRRYYAQNPAAARAKTAQWRAKNRPKLQAYAREYARSHRAASRMKSKQRRARKAHAPVNDFTHVQWVTMQASYDHRCAYCGKRAKGHLTQDHITPLSKGGSHTLHNIVPACRLCNFKKHTNPPPIPVQPLLL